MFLGCIYLQLDEMLVKNSPDIVDFCMFMAQETFLRAERLISVINACGRFVHERRFTVASWSKLHIAIALAF